MAKFKFKRSNQNLFKYRTEQVARDGAVERQNLERGLYANFRITKENKDYGRHSGSYYTI